MDEQHACNYLSIILQHIYGTLGIRDVNDVCMRLTFYICRKLQRTSINFQCAKTRRCKLDIQYLTAWSVIMFILRIFKYVFVCRPVLNLIFDFVTIQSYIFDLTALKASCWINEYKIWIILNVFCLWQI